MNRAKTREIEFLLTAEDIKSIFDRSRSKCEITGIPFSNSRPDHLRIRPWAPSIDRIDSCQGYTVENTRLICAAMNLALNEFGEDIFARIALSYVKFKPAKVS